MTFCAGFMSCFGFQMFCIYLRNKDEDNMQDRLNQNMLKLIRDREDYKQGDYNETHPSA